MILAVVVQQCSEQILTKIHQNTTGSPYLLHNLWLFPEKLRYLVFLCT